MKKILITSNSLIIGGIEKSLINFLDNIDYKKYDVTLVLEEKKGELLNKVNKNVKVIELKVSKCKISIIRKIINFTRKKIFSLKYKNKFDFSCCYATYSYSANKLALIGSKNSSIYIHSDYTKVYNENSFYNFFNTRNINLFKKIIFVSNESKENFIKKYPNLKKKALVINNFINIEKIKNKSLEKIEINKDDSYTTFVFVGRLDDKSKKLTRAIDIIKNIDNTKLIVVGDGPDEKKYKDYVKKLEIIDRVIFIGKKMNPYPYMLLADYIILTSLYEGFPVVFLEAIVLNKNIISTVKVSDEEIEIGKNYGYVVSNNDKEIISDVEKILKNNKNNNYINLEKIQNKRKKILEKVFEGEI